MIDAPNPSTSSVKKLRKQARHHETEPHHLVHEMLNQLTVMNLSCFKFRAAAEKCCPPSLLVEIERMERAVVEMTALLESVSQAANSKVIGRALGVVHGSDGKPASNVYPLFKPTKR